MGNNSVPKFIFRLSRFPVYRGSVLGRFYCNMVPLPTCPAFSLFLNLQCVITRRRGPKRCQNFRRPGNYEIRLPFFLSSLLPPFLFVTSFTNEQRQSDSVARKWQKPQWRYSCQSVWNLEHNISPERCVFSGIRHCHTDVKLCYVTVRQTYGPLSCQFLANRVTGMPQTWEITWSCRKQHVGWPTKQMACSWRSTQTATGCVHFQMSLYHGTHLNTR